MTASNSSTNTSIASASAEDDASSSIAERSYNDEPYLHATAHLAVPGLFRNFHTAATLLCVSRSELRTSLLGQDGNRVVSDFYCLLDEVEASIEDLRSKTAIVMHKKFIVEVEGLDGSGKTSLVQSLSESFQGAAAAMKTPSPSLAAIRPLFDHRRGLLARAFYFISNYVLEYEISRSETDIIVVDRWYASTLAYTVAYRPKEDNFDIGDLPDDIFQWPSDLNLRPHLMLLLEIDPATRQARVEKRKALGGGASRFNPWDDRLDSDPCLGERIMSAMKTIRGPLLIHVLNANDKMRQVQGNALTVVKCRYQQVKQPDSYYKDDPLMWWRHDGEKLGLCDEQGKRRHHALWNLQVSFGKENAPPVLKTVGLDHIDSRGVYHWSSSSVFDNDIHNRGILGSILWCAGNYPLEFQWRAEGFFVKVTKEECLLFGLDPPRSLSRHMKACEESANSASDKTCSSRKARDGSYDAAIEKSLVNKEECASSTICIWRFIPIRIEVIRGGPSTRMGSYPQRFEWTRSQEDGKWCMRSILPFTTFSLRESFTIKPCTVALMGTHTAGKTTIGSRLSALIGWKFDTELGNDLRNNDNLVANGHLHGDGGMTDNSSSCKDQWDKLLLEKESERDGISQGCRVVETWHGGNAAWCYLRRKKELSKAEFNSTILQKYLQAMKKHRESTTVLMIFRSIDSANTIINRRSTDHNAFDRIPLQDEKGDAEDLLCLNDKDFYEHMAKVADIPMLVVDNTDCGEAGIEKTLKSVLHFLLEHSFRRVRVEEDIDKAIETISDSLQ